MIVECITVTCPPGKRDAFIQRDDEVWTAGLMTQPAFLGKEVWTDPNDPDNVYLAIHLKSREPSLSVFSFSKLSDRVDRTQEQESHQHCAMYA
jgi:uncharacterized protein (TIGR03792 family)